MGIYFFTSLYLQGELGLSPTTAGAAFMPLTLPMAAGAPLASTLAARIGTNRTVAGGFVLVAAGMLLVARWASTPTWPTCCPACCWSGSGPG
jgi:predicted MFS family arabinose efflux permease